jgi:hypothetical protein
MVRRVVSKSGKFFLDNEFQERFVIERDQIEDVIALLEEAEDWVGVLPVDGSRVSERDRLLKCGDLYIVNPGTEQQTLTMYNERTDDSMWFRNAQMIGGVRKEWEEHYDGFIESEVKQV